ncbi:MAG: SH3 domain-containing protein [Synechococcales bacterium]|nr:SH3 domain-containing protein [Synechococcales bacterium]
MNLKSVLFTLATLAATAFISSPALARPATLIAEDANARINIRSNPTTQAKALHSGRVGNSVEVLRQIVPKNENYAWSYVRFKNSGVEGWVRIDFIQYSDSRDTYASLMGGSNDDRINLRSAPSTQGRVLHYGLSGDVVKVVRESKGDGSYVWHYVEFPSGAQGWVRSDLIQIWGEGGCAI